MGSFEIYVLFFVHFCLPKKRTKKGSRSLGLRLPCATRKKTDASESRTPCGVLRRVVFLFFTPLLGFVKWRF